MSSRSHKPSARLSLPWERGPSPWQRALSGRRYVPLLVPALLLGLALVTYQLGTERADLQATRAMLTEVERATQAFVSDLGRCPEDLSELVHPPKSGTQYLRTAPLDAWERTPQLSCSAGEQAQIEAISAGPSGSFLDDDNVM